MFNSMLIHLPQKLAVVKYDRQARAWRVLNGKVTSFPAGPEGKLQAELYALEHDRPDVAAEVQALIQSAECLRRLMFDTTGIVSRAVKAGFLLRDGKVLPPVPFDQPGGCMNEIARVQGSETQPYIITYTDELCYCDCQDFLSGDAPYLPN